MRTLAVLLIIVAAIAQTACNRTPRQKDFASAEEAVQALVAAARADDTRALLRILGAEAAPVIESGDPVQDKNGRERFVHEFEATHAFENNAEGATILNVGADPWPFPFPLVQNNGRWRFDSGAGTDEIVNRRIGRNELDTIQSALAFVDAQREYYMRNPQQDPLMHFAQKLVSSKGQKDGLYWPTTGNEEPSPLGAAFAAARSEGYFQNAPVKDTPFHGYLYRLLTAQGPNAMGGAYDYMVRDQMLGGFALIAVPAEYGSTGVMSFIVNHDGVVFSRDLGPETPKVAMAIDKFNPDQNWKREAAIGDR
ncbi:MAG TPA: DUF2950 domain-containing protein [Povalibacter sp.]|nr:DUF2950 domain-containing protein [Povalibacter sp.]